MGARGSGVRGSTPPPLRSSPTAQTRGASGQWFSPLKPIGAFKGPPGPGATHGPGGRTHSPESKSPTAPGHLSAGRRSNSPGYSKRKTPPAPQPAADSSDDEPDAYDESSEEDGTGTLQQQEGKRARRERRRAHQEFMRRIRTEKKGIHERVTAAIFKCDDVLNDDLEAQKEEAQELRDNVQEIVDSYKVLKSKGIEELFNIKFNDHSSVLNPYYQPSVDLDEFKVDDVNDAFNKMSSTRDGVEHKAHMMIDMAIAMVNNDDSKQLLHDQQCRFVDEVNTLVKSLERVESHAKGLTQNNIDLRLQLRQAQDEARDWKRKFEKIENTKDSMSRQMAAAISQRTQALKANMSGSGGDEMSSIMDQLTQTQEHNLELKESITKLRREVVEEQVKTQKAEESIKQQNLDMQDLRQAAGPTADLIQKLRDEAENYKKGELMLRKELHASRQKIKQVRRAHRTGEFPSHRSTCSPNHLPLPTPTPFHALPLNSMRTGSSPATIWLRWI